MAAPEESCTDPVIEPYVVCALAIGAKDERRVSDTASVQNQRDDIFTPTGANLSKERFDLGSAFFRLRSVCKTSVQFEAV
jgi:hypothetical protein